MQVLEKEEREIKTHAFGTNPSSPLLRAGRALGKWLWDSLAPALSLYSKSSQNNFCKWQLDRPRASFRIIHSSLNLFCRIALQNFFKAISSCVIYKMAFVDSFINTFELLHKVEFYFLNVCVNLRNFSMPIQKIRYKF